MAKSRIKVHGLFRSTDQVKENIIPTLVGAGIRGAGVLGAAYTATYVKKVLPEKMASFAGLLQFVAGTIGEAYIENEEISKAAQGYAAGGLMMAALNIGGVKTAMAKQGFSIASQDAVNGLGLPEYEYQYPSTIGEIGSVDYDAIISGIEGAMAGIEEMPVNGVDVGVSGIGIQDNALLGIC